jgi:hypothetical protein
MMAASAGAIGIRLKKSKKNWMRRKFPNGLWALSFSRDR